MTQAELQTLIDTLRNETVDGANTKTRVADIFDALKEKQITAQSYSTDETLTGGTWIDGKPIYRKCFVLGQITTAFQINHNLNIDTYIVKKLNGYLSGDKEYCSISQELHTNIGGINELGFGSIQTATNLFSFENASEIIIENTVITLEYTKTTY